MPFARAHAYLNLSGTVFTSERFSIGLRLNNVAGTFPAGQVAQQALCDQYATAVGTWWAGQSVIGSAARLDLVKLNEVSPLGKYVRAWTNLKELIPSVAAGAPSNFPPQVSLVASLRTGAQRGGAARGRIFLPAPSVPMQTNGVMSVAAQNVALTAVKGLIDAVNGVDPGRMVIVASKVGVGAERSVTRVEVGCVFDTMRSRRSNFAELPIGVDTGVAGFQKP